MFHLAATTGEHRTQTRVAPGRIRVLFRAGRRRETGGFTLIELLVVIAIISLLVSILIPSLKRAKELTRRVVCGSNLHQMGVALMTYAADHKGEFPEGGRTAAAPYFIGFYGRGWKNSLYPKYVQVPELCYCPSRPDFQPDSYVAADPWDLWDYLSYDYCIIGYIYTPNQQTVREDLQGNVFPRNAEEAYPTSVVMGDRGRHSGAESAVRWNWNHLIEDPQGGNWMGGDGHVEWRDYSQQLLRVSDSTPWGSYELWW